MKVPSMLRTVVGGVAHFVPERVVTNRDLESLMDTSDEWITQRTGIKERRWVEDGTTTAELACQAVGNLLKATGRAPDDINMIVAATLSPDLYFPGIGTLIQHRMGFGHIGAIDLRAQCSGFTYGLSVADGLIRTGQAKRLIYVGAEVHSPVLDKTTGGRDVAVLFGDGAAAMLLEAEDVDLNKGFPQVGNDVRGVIDSLLGADGSGAESLMMRSPGIATPGFVRIEQIEANELRPFMDGRTVFKNAVTRMVESAATILQRNGLRPEDVDWLVPHQANLRINEAVADRIGIPGDRVFNNIQKYGNTTAATIPLCLSEASEQGLLKPGQIVLTLSFGAGFTWGANLIRW